MEYEILNGIKPYLNKKDEKINKDSLDRYKKLFESQEIIQLKFERASYSTNELCIDEIVDGETIIVKMSHEDSINHFNQKHRLSNKLEVEYSVVVTGINEHDKEVSVSHSLAMKMLKKQVNDQIKLNMERKRAGEDIKVILPVKVIRIDTFKNMALVDICGYGIKGFIPGALAQHLGVNSISRLMKPGEVFDVEILHPKTNEDGQHMYCCSRISTLSNPWSGIENKFHKNDIIQVVCVQKRKRNWFGEIKGLSGIQVFCEYPDESNGVTNILVQEGHRYLGYIYSVSEERKLLKARIYKEIPLEK